MNESSSSKSKLNPILLGLVGLLVIAAIGFGLSRMAKSTDETGAAGSSARNSSKASGRHGDSSAGDPRHRGKSADKTEEERIAGTPSADPKTGEEIQELLVRVSVSARGELQKLRAISKTKFDDPEERKAFGARLSQVRDPAERQEMLRDRTAAMRAARAEADALKSSVDIEREKQLIVLMQVQNLWRMSEFVRKNPKLSSDALDFNEDLVSWVQRSGNLDNERFHSEFDELRKTLSELRKRNGVGVRPVLTPAVDQSEEYSPK